MKPRALFSVFTKCSYCHVHRFADSERMELTAPCSSSPFLVMMQDTFCKAALHLIESELAFVPTTTLVVGYFAVAEATIIFGFEEGVLLPTITRAGFILNALYSKSSVLLPRCKSNFHNAPARHLCHRTNSSRLQYHHKRSVKYVF